MEKLNIKYNRDGTLRPFPNRQRTEDMTDREISQELMDATRLIEKNSIEKLKIQKLILSWIQFFGVVLIIGLILNVVAMFFL